MASLGEELRETAKIVKNNIDPEIHIKLTAYFKKHIIWILRQAAKKGHSFARIVENDGYNVLGMLWEYFAYFQKIANNHGVSLNRHSTVKGVVFRW